MRERSKALDDSERSMSESMAAAGRVTLSTRGWSEGKGERQQGKKEKGKRKANGNSAVIRGLF
jgi:hypothetical protein